MSVHRPSLITICCLLAATPASAGLKPVAVSPGDSSKIALIDDPCPTFSWGQLAGAKSYDLVVYRLGREGEETPPVVRESFAGSVSSWTPSLDRCLERGGRYAWSLRGWRGRKPSDWSPAMLFQVATGPAAAEFRAVRAILQEYLAPQRGSIGQSAARSLPELLQDPSGIEIANDSIRIDGDEVFAAGATLGETCTNGATRTARVCILTAVSGFGDDGGACELFPIANGWRLDIVGGAQCCMDCWE